MSDKEKVAMVIGYLKGIIANWNYDASVPVDEVKKFISEIEGETLDK